ncbi:MAG: hypothetical protein IT328_14260 [Caldilineaceae bacterium]|nr:hypothetical protein [Caldilineaceae bacterium]
MAVIEAALSKQPGYTIVRVDPTQHSTTESLVALDPHVVFMDDSTCPRLLENMWATLLRVAPQTTVIVLALKSFVLQRQPQPQPTANVHPIQDIAELMDLIHLGRWPNRCE